MECFNNVGCIASEKGKTVCTTCLRGWKNPEGMKSGGLKNYLYLTIEGLGMRLISDMVLLTQFFFHCWGPKRFQVEFTWKRRSMKKMQLVLEMGLD